MKQFLLLVLSACFAPIAYAQYVPEKDTSYLRRYHPIELGVTFSPNMDYRLFTPNDQVWSGAPEGYVEEKRAMLNEREKPMFGYNVALQATINFNRTIGMFLGFQHAQVNYKYRHRMYGYVIYIGNPERVMEYVNQIKCIGVPVGLKLGFGKKKVRFSYTSGVEVNWVYSARSIVTYAIHNDPVRTVHEPLEDSPSFNYSVFASAGVDYYLLDNMRLNASPIFRYSLVHMTKETGWDVHPWSIGLSVGIHYGF